MDDLALNIAGGLSTRCQKMASFLNLLSRFFARETERGSRL
jgi:hypothetical protein